VDLKDYEWCYAIYTKYLKIGDIRELAELVRSKPIPERYRDAVAEILNGDLKPSNLNQKAIRSDYKKQRYYKYWTLSLVMDDTKEARDFVINGFARDFYKGDIDTARRIINRHIKDDNWAPLPIID